MCVFFSPPLLVGNTLTVAVWSITVPHRLHVQLGTLNISLFDSLQHVFRKKLCRRFMTTCAAKTTTIKLKFHWVI